MIVIEYFNKNRILVDHACATKVHSIVTWELMILMKMPDRRLPKIEMHGNIGEL